MNNDKRTTTKNMKKNEKKDRSHDKKKFTLTKTKSEMK